MKVSKSIHDMNGLTKREVTARLYEEWKKTEMKIQGVEEVYDFHRIIWNHPSGAGSWALTHTGYTILKDFLHVDPYSIPFEYGIYNSQFVVDLGKAMPWPYRLLATNNPSKAGSVEVFSREVATWAGLYGKDIQKLINVYLEAAKV